MLVFENTQGLRRDYTAFIPPTNETGVVGGRLCLYIRLLVGFQPELKDNNQFPTVKAPTMSQKEGFVEILKVEKALRPRLC